MPDLIAILEQSPAGSWPAFIAVALAGLLMGVAPSSLPLISVVMGFVAGRQDAPSGRAWMAGLAPSVGFVVAMAMVDAAIGALFGLLGFVVVRALATHLAFTYLVIGLVLVVLGLAMLRLVRVRWPTPRRPRTTRPHSFAAGFALGVPVGLTTCPACTPIVLPILGAAASSATPWAGAALLFTFGLARGIPVMIAGSLTGSVKHVRWLAPWVVRVEAAGGIVLLFVAGYFLYLSAVYGQWLP
ncbi:cytochrome c biogenesis CcdA family protein [Arhodomonas sp. AD133]|uniref:cytochrome c biogenesis CcdA family protein n=1 Tax=Arhodomonas sp. AD133 TaxID=3415009 RepID=UPI003EBB84D2